MADCYYNEVQRKNVQQVLEHEKVTTTPANLTLNKSCDNGVGDGLGKQHREVDSEIKRSVNGLPKEDKLGDNSDDSNPSDSEFSSPEGASCSITVVGSDSSCAGRLLDTVGSGNHSPILAGDGLAEVHSFSDEDPRQKHISVITTEDGNEWKYCDDPCEVARIDNLMRRTATPDVEVGKKFYYTKTRVEEFTTQFPIFIDEVGKGTDEGATHSTPNDEIVKVGGRHNHGSHKPDPLSTDYLYAAIRATERMSGFEPSLPGSRTNMVREEIPGSPSIVQDYAEDDEFVAPSNSSLCSWLCCACYLIRRRNYEKL